jgi:hypothetical protein
MTYAPRAHYLAVTALISRSSCFPVTDTLSSPRKKIGIGEKPAACYYIGDSLRVLLLVDEWEFHTRPTGMHFSCSAPVDENSPNSTVDDIVQRLA